MTKKHYSAPQKGLQFRVVAFFARLQFRYLYKNVTNPRILALLFVFLAGTTSLGTIAMAAYLANLPLLFPPLGPSAFVLFHTPMSETASPRSVIVSHSLGVVLGLLSLHLFAAIFPEANLFDSSVVNWHRVFCIALAMALTTVAMLSLNVAHPPAAASALIASMAYLDAPTKIGGLLTAVILLAIEGIFFNRVLGGLPYPIWRANPEVVRNYGVLAGIPKSGEGFWEELAAKMFQRR